MALDPNQCFVIWQISREEIAENLNRMLPAAVIATDDDRLTDEVCQEYADGLWEIADFEGDEDYNAEQEEALQRRVLKETFGLDA